MNTTVAVWFMFSILFLVCIGLVIWIALDPKISTKKEHINHLLNNPVLNYFE